MDEPRAIRPRRDAEDGLRHWNAVFESSAIGIALTDLDGRFLNANGAYQRITGYTAEELGDLRFIEITHERDRDVNLRLIAELLAGERQEFRIEKRYLRKDGSQIWVHNGVTLVPGTDETPRHIMAIVEDLTESKRLASRMQQERDRLRLLLEVNDSLVSRRDLRGVFDVVVARLLESHARLARESSYLKGELDAEHDFTALVGNSPAHLRVLEQIETAAAIASPVLLLGEPGTGKELLARALHELSPRRGHLFVKMDCAALPPDLLESQLFGYAQEAAAAPAGRVEVAHGGTLFLDEVGDLPPVLQAKLLRLIEEQEFDRPGAAHATRVDVRVVAATNRDLARLVAEGEFRADLFARLHDAPILVPALRDRADDIPPLVERFVRMFARHLGKRITHISDETFQRLVAYTWPGNLRELKNVIERAVILSSGDVLAAPIAQLAAPAAPSPDAAAAATERAAIVHALDECGWVMGGRDGAAARLGIRRETLQAKMQRLRITRPPRR